MTYAAWAERSIKAIGSTRSSAFMQWYNAISNNQGTVPGTICEALQASFLMQKAAWLGEREEGAWLNTIYAVTYDKWLEIAGCDETLNATSTLTVGTQEIGDGQTVINTYAGSNSDSATDPSASTGGNVQSDPLDPPQSADATDEAHTPNESLIGAGKAILSGLGTAAGWLTSKVAGEEPAPWTTTLPSSTPASVLARAKTEQPGRGWIQVAPLIMPKTYGSTTAYWCGTAGDERGWVIPTGRNVPGIGWNDNLGRDDSVPHDAINFDRQSGMQSANLPTGGGSGASLAPGSPGSLAQFGLSGIPPNTYTVRRCTKGRVMAIDGLCYLKSILPMKFRMNRTKKALLTHADKRNMQKGFRKARQLKEITKEQAKIAKSLQPPAPRRRPPPKK